MPIRDRDIDLDPPPLALRQRWLPRFHRYPASVCLHGPMAELHPAAAEAP